MEAVLYICHGSRLKKAQEEAAAFVHRCMLENPVPIQEYGFLELATPTIEQGFRKCIEKGATKILTVPVLLLTAGHAKLDIPLEMERLMVQFPGVEVVLGNPIGVHPDISQLLVERISETNELISDDTMVLLVGRGSSDPEVKRDLMRIAKALQQESGIKNVESSFLVAATPSFEESLQNAVNSSYQKIVVIPYILFTGLLMSKLAKTIQSYNEKTNKQIILGNYLGYHPILSKILLERVKEAQLKGSKQIIS
ncbi:sirohydrochlorin chelatase [Bacillus sp. DNRA2]|uniref:sirohydrochlorin chelatase n=1 Tax=Bacillus sp. DNRA2 TaxID=2723053 RepID=UPI00145C49E2|nr:sirohydrochlorin chelatase [Bacillus sp. DNRA2]NMD69197.1 sirohydrochlorin chelatase [Bacillus sp. DNRA2]